MEQSLVRTSKFLSLVLRHQPDLIGLTLDQAGWVAIPQLIDAVNNAGHNLSHDILLRVVHENSKQRFAISTDGQFIRANQGHSVDVDLGLTPLIPPEILFHGTVAPFVDSIRLQGLKAGQRQHVHLSADRATAEIVARRRGAPVILTIQAARMAADGLPIYCSANGVWLTDHVPPQFLTFPKPEEA